MDACVVKANNLEVSYGKRHALSVVSMQINGNAGVVGLFGPNGAGKSTLLRTIVGDIARVQGQLVAPQGPNIAYLPDAPLLYPWLTVAQCERLFSSRHGDFRHAVFDDMLAGSKITVERKIGELSKGMSERVHLALVMARSPELYVLDEPLGGVDPVTRDSLLELIQVLRAPDVPMLLSTHLINGVDRIFDEIMVIADGRLVTHEAASVLRERGNGDLERAYKTSVAGL